MTNKKNEFVCIKEELWKEHKCLRFTAGGYEALIVPEVGANVIELKDTVRGLSLLRSPNNQLDFQAFKQRPQVYGLPVLFPPNRIEDGTFKVEGRVYKFPINEPNNNNYMHGFIKNDKWKIVRKEIVNESEVEIEAIFDFNEKHEFYKYFSHKFKFKLIYNLSSRGLTQTASVINLSDEKMPVGVGFHTAFNIPFNSDGEDDEYKVIASIDKRWEQDGRNLTTGKILDLTSEEKQYLNKGINPSAYKIESHYTLKNMNIRGTKFNGAIIEDVSKGLRLIYKMGHDYKHVVIWNDMGDKHYICIEPQTCMINAPNIDLDKDITGFKMLLPMDTWSETCTIYVEDIN